MRQPKNRNQTLHGNQNKKRKIAKGSKPSSNQWRETKPSLKNSQGNKYNKLSNQNQFSSNGQRKKKQHVLNNSKNLQSSKNDRINPIYEDQEQTFDANLTSSKNQQYQQLLSQSTKGFKRQKNLYFLQNQKYKGRTQINEEDQLDQNESQDFQIEEEQEDISQPDQLLDEESQEQMHGDQEDDYQDEQEFQQQASQNQQKVSNQIHQALNLLKQKRSHTSKLLNEQINSINKQDEQSLKRLKALKSKTTSQQQEQAQQLKKLLQIYDNLVALRYNQQKQLQNLKMFPKIDEESQKYPPTSHELYTSNKQLQNQLISNLSNLYTLYRKIGNKCGFMKLQQNGKMQQQQQEHTLQETIQNDVAQSTENQFKKLNVDKVFHYIQENIQPFNKEVEKQLIKWSQKTSLLTSTNASQYNSLLMQTPIGQAKKVLSNWQRMTHKCQQKRGAAPFKILFEPEDNIHTNSDPQIYDDYDLFIELEKYYLQKLDNDEDGQFLQSATMKYLKNRQANQLAKQASKKQVDRKASKNRKIRYNVHAKLLNFMPSIPQNCIETRDQIVRNIFNCNAIQNEEALEGNVAKYRTNHLDAEEDFIQVA